MHLITWNGANDWHRSDASDTLEVPTAFNPYFIPTYLRSYVPNYLSDYLRNGSDTVIKVLWKGRVNGAQLRSVQLRRMTMTLAGLSIHVVVGA